MSTELVEVAKVLAHAPEQVWHVLGDPALYPRFVREVAWCERVGHGSLGSGARFRVRFSVEGGAPVADEIEILVHRTAGFEALTMAAVAERAGVSRGAAQHHFPAREDLVTAAVEFVAEERTARLREHVADLPSGPGRTQAVVDLVEHMYTGPLFRAALQLWVAASSDDQLRARVVPLEAHVGRETHRVALELLGVDEKWPGVREVVQATLDMARGLGLANLLTDDSRRRGRIMRQWAKILDDVLAEARGD